MKITVFSRQTFEEFICDDSHIAISITDPDSEPVIINENNNNLISMLSIQFHDVDKRLKNRKDCKLCDGTGKSKLFLMLMVVIVINALIKWI